MLSITALKASQINIFEKMGIQNYTYDSNIANNLNTYVNTSLVI